MAHGLLNAVLLELVRTDLLRKFQWLEAAQKDRRGRHPPQTVFLCPISGLGEMGAPPGRSAAAGPGGSAVEGRQPGLQAAHRGGC